jgi:hypothetical protein
MPRERSATRIVPCASVGCERGTRCEQTRSSVRARAAVRTWEVCGAEEHQRVRPLGGV